MTLFTGSFMGISMQQYWNDLYLWETFFNNYDVRTLIELGTGHGGMALFLAMECRQRGIKYFTLDNVRSVPGNELMTLLGFESHFRCVDIFEGGHGIIETILREEKHPAMIFFDDGNKPREWRMYAPMLGANDFCAVHDWETEFNVGDINGVPVKKILEDGDAGRPIGMRTAWFKRL